jgi:Mn2+/Fe2+ NRAMP family transporter
MRLQRGAQVRAHGKRRPLAVGHGDDRAFLGFLTFPPMLLLFLRKPVAIVQFYAAVGGLFMPFLAATLLYLNNHPRWMPTSLRNRWASNLLLLIAVGVFVYLSLNGVIEGAK